MIIREIATKPDVLDNFDFFNDYKDTRRWAEHNCPEVIAELDESFREWLRRGK